MSEVVAKKRECCQVEENLGTPQETLAPHLTVRVCSVCGAKHYELEIDAGDLVGRGQEIGG